MIEQATIITGSPAKTELQLREFLASHPNATVISSSIHVSHPLSACLAETSKPATKQAKAKAKETEDSSESPIPDPQSIIAPQEHITVCIIAGIVL